ncbi:hypothetical protein SODALDRAFT_327119, partial [Sodiomyces alkalinus F11]
MITPIVLSPATPAELLQYILAYQTHPTTLLICSTRADFLSSLAQDVQAQVQVPRQHESRDDNSDGRDTEAPKSLPLPLLAAPIYQVAVARHIRMLFLPTVTHLRAYLAVFTPHDSKVPPPPLRRTKGLETTSTSTSASSSTSNCPRPPLLLAYGFLSLHRDTSEWSAQGIGSTAAALVEAASPHEFRAAVVEPRGDGGHANFHSVLSEPAPVLSRGVRRDEGGWMGRTVEVRSVLARWFRFQSGQWDLK